MKNILTFEKFNNFSISEKEKEKILESPDGFNTRKDAEEHLDTLLKWDYANMNDVVTLYRVLFTDKIDKSKLGYHWTNEVDNIYDDHWIDLIRETTDAPSVEPKVIVAKFRFSDIDQYRTLHTNLLYPDEQEIRIKDNCTPISYNIYNLDEFRKKSILQWRRGE